MIEPCMSDEDLEEVRGYHADCCAHIPGLLATIDADRARIAELEGRDEQSTQTLAAVSQTCIDQQGRIAALEGTIIDFLNGAVVVSGNPDIDERMFRKRDVLRAALEVNHEPAV